MTTYDITTDKGYLNQLADELDAGPRMGNDKDEPEGVRSIQISDTMVEQIAARLREIAGRMPESEIDADQTFEIGGTVQASHMEGDVRVIDDFELTHFSCGHGFVQTEAEPEELALKAMGEDDD